MSVWVQFLRDGKTKQNYRDFKQVIEVDREEVRQKERKETIGNRRNKFERMKSKVKAREPLPEGITFTSP